ncbi:MAG: hypothetical protein ACLPID_15750 [Beijerinckiaceae bacterium]
MKHEQGPDRGGSATRNPSVGTLRRVTKLLGGAAIAPLILAGVGLSSAQAQSASDPSQLQAQIEALKAKSEKDAAQLRAEISALKSLIKTSQSQTTQQVRQVQQLQASYPPATPYEPPFFADKKIHLNGVTITPGGYFEAAGIWRSRNEQADLGSNWANIPTLNNPLANMDEFRFTARGTRASLLVEGQPHPSTIVSGYGELDFQGAAQTADSNEKNAYNPRIRQLWGAADWNDWGLHVVAGQTFSLTTLYAAGLKQLNEATPPVIDQQYLPGFVWKRQPGIRLTKDFGSVFWASIAVENPQTTFATKCGTLNGGAASTDAPSFPTGGGISYLSCASPGGSGFNSANNYSINQIPDIVGKVAFDPKIEGRSVHLEGFGIYRDFYDQVAYAALPAGNYTNYNATGWGVGGGLVAQVVPKFLDIQGNVLYGRGIGSYGAGQLGDVTFNQNGSEVGIPELIFSVGATAHVTSAIDVYAFYGSERQSAQYYGSGATAYGIGVPIANNTGCYTDNDASSSCAGNTQALWQITGGVWDKVYQGAFGEARVGVQYSYTKKELFPGAATTTAPTLSASTDENVVLVSLRYYPFADFAPPPPPVVAKY